MSSAIPGNLPEWGTPEREALRDEFTAELIAALAADGITAVAGGTGGGCMALEVTLSPMDADGFTDYVLITDGNADLPDGDGGYVGRYRPDADPEMYLATEEATTVPQFVAAVHAAIRGDVADRVDG